MYVLDTASINSNDKEATCQMNSYILLTFLVAISLLTIVIICYYFIKHRSNQKDITILII